METVEPVTWNLAKGNLLYLTDKEEQMTALVKHIAKGKQKVIVLAPKYHNLPEMEGVTVSTGDTLVEMIDALELRIKEHLVKGQSKHIVSVIIYDMSYLVDELAPELLNQLSFIIERSSKAGYGIVIMSTVDLNRRIDVASKAAKTAKQAILGIRITDQPIITVTNRPLREGALQEQVHYYVDSGIAKQIKVLMF